jgi:hypothetical protein
MSRYLLASTALLALATASGAGAEDIATKKTSPLRTSTVKGGGADAINITKDGSVVLTGGTAVTMDSDHAVSNAGAVTIGNANGATGIRAMAGTSGDIVNTGTITIDEPYSPTDEDKDGDLDGPFALGSNRYGIRTDGAHTGKITSSGTIVVEGNNSAGIFLGGTLTGNFVHDGKIDVLGNHSAGIETGAIDGNVRLAGSVAVRGEGATGARISGDVNGAVTVQGTVVATGYRSTTVPADTSKLDADDLLQGGSALVIEGSVSGGIILAVPPKDSNPDNADEDADGIEDAKEGAAKVVSYGAAPAMVVGATGRDIAIGPVAGTASQYGLLIDGAVEGRGLYSGVDAMGLAVGGRGGAVTIAGGIGIAGSVGAESKGGSATAVRLGSGASTPVLRVSGIVAASGGNTAAAHARAIHIAGGASLPEIRNSGGIKASAQGENGSATAILDESGTVTLVENSGAILAEGAKAGSGRNVAIDLSSAAGGVTIRQTQVAAGFAAPSIVGDIRLSGGDDVVDIADGGLAGDVTFGGGSNRLSLSGDAVQKGAVAFGGGNDTVTLAGTASFTGAMDFGGGSDLLTLSGTSLFSGSLANAANLAVKVEGGTLDLRTPSQISSLSVAKDGVLAVTLNKAGGSAYTVGGIASFTEGSTLSVRLADVSTAEGSYQVLTAAAIEGLDKLKTVTDLVPFMFKAELNKSAAPNTIVVDVARRSVGELGLNRSQTSAYDAVFAALGSDDKVEGVFLGITNGDRFREAVGQMLPDHAGGAFEGISLGARTLARQLQDPQGPLVASGRMSATVNLAFWGSDKDTGSSAAYDLSGYSWSLTGEYRTGLGHFGATVAHHWNRHTRGSASEVKSDAWELAGHWRGNWGAFSGFGRASIGSADFGSERSFTGLAGAEEVKRKIEGNWNGTFVTFAAGASVEGGTQYLYFRPALSLDYVRLKEGGYTETGGGKALDLAADARTSDELGVNGGLTLGADLMGMGARDQNWLRIETEGGWREIVGGGLGATTARFENGEAFTLDGETADGGWFARLRAFGGSAGFVMGGELSAEDRHDQISLAVRGSLKIAW